jgi:hypothetical protein
MAWRMQTARGDYFGNKINVKIYPHIDSTNTIREDVME